MSEAPADWDGAWKDSLTGLLPWFLAKYFPHVHADIDWSRGYEPLDQELQKIIPGAATGVLRADLLFKVWLRSAKNGGLLIHIEIQAQRDPDFPERVFDYNTLIKHVSGTPWPALPFSPMTSRGGGRGRTHMISGAVEASSTSPW